MASDSAGGAGGLVRTSGGIGKRRLAPWLGVAAVLVLVLTSLAILWTSTGEAPGASTPRTFVPEADARVEQSQPNQNYSADPGLLVDQSPRMESYLRFTISNLSGEVRRATLRLYAYDGTSDGPQVFAASNTWTESQISWNNRPARSGSAVDDEGTIVEGSWVEFDVTPLVSGNGIITFNLTATSSDGVDFFSREASSNQPQLVVVTASGSTTMSTLVPTPAPSFTITSEASPPGGSVTAAVETAPVPHAGDAADDSVVWIHPTDPSRSTIIGTDKLGGLAVYDLSGEQLHYYADSKPNNVDIRYNVLLGRERVALVTTSNRSNDSIMVYRVDSSTHELVDVSARTLSVGMGLYGLCMYHSPKSGKYYTFVNDNSGTVQQWELFDNGAGKIDAKKVRSFDVGSTTEGCVADDLHGTLYISEEEVGIWKYSAEPNAGTSRVKVDGVGDGHLTADVEGLTIYYAGEGAGYLIASSQGNDSFVVYDRQGNNSYIKTFQIEAGRIDDVTHTDGISVTNFALGSIFPEGVFIAQDDRNDSGNQNFKLVSWGLIARHGSQSLTIDTSWDPRTVGGPPGSVQTAVASPATPPTPGPSLTTVPTPTSPNSSLPTGNTYYVDSVNGSDSNAGTSETTAWKTLSKVSSVALAPGDRVLLKRGGRWPDELTLNANGSASAPITIGAYGNGNRPLITGGSTCVELNGSYLVLRDLQISGCSWAGVRVSGSNNRVEGNLVTQNVSGIYVDSGAVANRILNNDIRDNNRMSVLTRSPRDDDSGAFGVLLHGDQTEVAYNTISGSDTFSYDYGRDGAAIEIYGAQNSHIHHNVAIDNHAFSELGNARSAGNVFAYNVVHSGLASSTFLVTRGAESGYGPVLGTQLYNNTVYLTGSESQGVVCHAGCSSDILTMRNNIIQAGWKVGYADGPFDEDYGLYFGGQIQFTQGSHSTVANPVFVDVNSGNLALTPSSPAVDAGVDVGYTSDINGATVPGDGNGDGQAVPDLGAYEYAR